MIMKKLFTSFFMALFFFRGLRSGRAAGAGHGSWRKA